VFNEFCKKNIRQILELVLKKSCSYVNMWTTKKNFTLMNKKETGEKYDKLNKRQQSAK